jgi:4-hydroxyphenylpyruvate dioxygenase
VREPWDETDEHGTVRMSTIAAYGETLHTFVERKDYTGPVPPRLRARARTARPTPACSRSTTSSATSSSAT